MLSKRVLIGIGLRTGFEKWIIPNKLLSSQHRRLLREEQHRRA